VGLLGVYTVLLFPDGRLPSRRWRPFAWFAGATMALIQVAFVLASGHVEGHPGVRNPFGLEQYPWLKLVAVLVVSLLPLCILISALSLALRYRRSGAEVREQIKWLAFAAFIVGATYLSALVVGILFVPTVVSGGDKTPLWYSLLLGFMLMSFAGIPTAIGFAVLKYRLYDIDLIINRTLVYGPLTVSLAAVYFGGVVGMQAAFRATTGQESTLAVVASTLAIAALFNPLLRRIQDFVDRRFYRRKYDAAKTLEAFSVRLRDETDLEALNDHLVGVISETMQPAHVSLWLRPVAGMGRSRESA
jgi:MFS family permease